MIMLNRDKFLFVDKRFVFDVRKRLMEFDSPTWKQVRTALMNKAELCMKSGPWSVTFHKHFAVSNNPHDYYSEGPFWWPVDGDPNAPFIYKDGQKWPDRFSHHRIALHQLAKHVYYLSYAGFYLEEQKYIDRAIELIEIWFIRSDTRMNPHLQYAEAVRNLHPGLSTGIIALRDLDIIIHSLCFLKQFSEWDRLEEPMNVWLGELLQWLTKSEFGQSEKRASNNHASWWTVHVAAMASYLNKKDVLFEAFEHYKQFLLPSQMDESGRFPEELQRTKSLYYSVLNLNAWILVAEIAFQHGEDLWRYSTVEGKSLRLAIQFILPYLRKTKEWEYDQIDQEVPDYQLLFQLAYLRLSMPESLSLLHQSVLHDNLLANDEGEAFGPLGSSIFMPGSLIH
jgi:hypothetical protein